MLTNLLLLTSLFVGPALACCDSRAANILKATRALRPGTT